MKKLLYILLSAILAAATACHHRSAASLGDFDISLYAPAYSSGFEIFGAEGMKSTILKTYAPWQGAEGEETQLFIARNGEQAPADFPGQVLDGDARRIVCMSSTYIAMLDALGEPQRVVGVSGIDYISNPYVASHKEQIGDVGYDGNMNYERLLSLSPDIVLLFGVSGASAMEPKLRELGIPYAYMGEYLEQSPLGKAEWLVAVAEIAGMRERGEEVFREIPLRYDSLKTLAAKAERKPVVMLNTPYGDSWLMAPPSSYVARLIADAGHELRTPLTSLRTNVELLVADERQGMLPPGARGEILRDIAAQLGEFTTLIGDLVHLSREDTVAPAPEPIDLRDVVEHAVARAKRRGPGLIFDVRLDPLYLVGEPESLERAVTNLLDNAVKFSPPGGTIEVHLEGDRLRIADQGPGINEEDLPHVFDRFYRASTARTTPGSGLGLSIVAQTIKSHGGWVKAGVAPGGGAEFTIRLPGTSVPPQSPAEQTTGDLPRVAD